MVVSLTTSVRGEGSGGRSLWFYFVNLKCCSDFPNTIENSLLTNEVSKLLVTLRLFPVSGPADHYGVVLETSEPTNLDQMGRPVSQIGGDDHLRKAFHLLCLHQFT